MKGTSKERVVAVKQVEKGKEAEALAEVTIMKKLSSAGDGKATAGAGGGGGLGKQYVAVLHGTRDPPERQIDQVPRHAAPSVRIR